MSRGGRAQGEGAATGDGAATGRGSAHPSDRRLQRTSTLDTNAPPLRYCLAPYGWGWGIRLSQIILSGCVPVIIQPHVFQPFEDLLDYSQFAIRLPR